MAEVVRQGPVWTTDTGKVSSPAITQAFDKSYFSPLVTGSGVNYTIGEGISYVQVETSHAHTVTLPNPKTNRGPITIMDVAGTGADTNNITVARFGTEKIGNTAGSLVMDNDRASVCLVSDGTDWHFAHKRVVSASE